MISIPPGTATIEMTGPLAAAVDLYLHANRLDGPTALIGDDNPSRLYLVTGLDRTRLAACYLETTGARIHTGTHSIHIPPAGPRRWCIREGTRDWVPPIVALAAAARCASSQALTRETHAPARLTREVSHV
ncbi:hypothetical protein [Nocardia nova]|jgi:hypothetical protein|uniref:hypothetical protein n=1 Tax=Nocardia nova TaxID=37330 RepID=UPI0007A49F13|nr:hypothetical protein [Nocardia nova]